jgi:hypothetical protein
MPIPDHGPAIAVKMHFVCEVDKLAGFIIDLLQK